MMSVISKITLSCIIVLTCFNTVSAEQTTPPESFNQCANCHTTMAEGQYRNAPPLTGIVGREIAAWPGFKYSKTLSSMKGIWTKSRLDAFLQRPSHALPGTKMYFRGLKSETQRTQLIEWLASADIPDIIPPRDLSKEKSSDRLRGQATSERLMAKLISDEDRIDILFRPCTACHYYAEGAPSKIGPNLYGVYGRPVASFPNFNYSDRLLRRGGVWSDEALHAFFTENKASYGQGSHAAFRKLTQREDRQLIINFLKSLPNPQKSSTATKAR